MGILQEEDELQEIVRLVGIDSLSEKDRLTLEAAKSLREDYLHQVAFHEVDTYTSLEKQYKMLRLVLGFYDLGRKALDEGVYLSKIASMPIRENIARAKYIKESEISKIDDIYKSLEEEMNDLIEGGKMDA